MLQLAETSCFSGHGSAILQPLPFHAGRVPRNADGLHSLFCIHASYGLIVFFPAGKEVSEYELSLLLQRYYNSEVDGINYMAASSAVKSGGAFGIDEVPEAMDKDLKALIEDSYQERQRVRQRAPFGISWVEDKDLEDEDTVFFQGGNHCHRS